MIPRLAMILCAAALASCTPQKAAAVLADGCYYSGGIPVFKVSGRDGQLLVPGDIVRFRVEPGDDAHVIFAPGFLLDGVAPDLRNQAANQDRQTVAVMPGAVPAVTINWAAYGESRVERGKAC